MCEFSDLDGGVKGGDAGQEPATIGRPVCYECRREGLVRHLGKRPFHRTAIRVDLDTPQIRYLRARGFQAKEYAPISRPPEGGVSHAATETLVVQDRLAVMAIRVTRIDTRHLIALAHLRAEPRIEQSMRSGRPAE